MRFRGLLRGVHRDLGLDRVSRFSDRPPVRAGDDSAWGRAESALRAACAEAGLEHETNLSAVAPAYGDTFCPGERISVAVRHNRSARVSGHGVPVLALGVGGNLRTARLDGRAS